MPSFSYTRGSNAHVDIEGLSDFISDLRAVEGDMDKLVLERGKAFGKTIVVRARAKAASDKQRAKAAKSLRVNTSARGVVITGGGMRSKFFWGAEFGGKRMTMGRKLPGGLKRGEKQKYGGFKRWTGNQFDSAGWDHGPGYFLNPAVNELSPKEINAYRKDITKIFDKAFNG